MDNNKTNIIGTQTEKNLQTAFAEESKARNKYTYFASQARKDGYKHIANYFTETAGNEKEHAKIWYKLHNDISSTSVNLQTSILVEEYEWTNMYQEYAKTARKEGLIHIAELFEAIAKIEHMHEERYRKLLDNIQQNQVFTKESDAIWICANYGIIIIGPKAPEECPVCSHTSLL